MKEEGKKMAHLNRRDFIKAVLASSALYAVGGSSSSWDVSAEGAGPISPGSGPFDVAIIGAGSAGIGAAQILKQARKNSSYSKRVIASTGAPSPIPRASPALPGT